MKFLKQKRGSIALISLLIISAFTLLIVLAASEASISTYQIYLNESSGETAYYGAESCLEEAIMRIEGDSDFSGTTLGGLTDGFSVVTQFSGGLGSAR